MKNLTLIASVLLAAQCSFSQVGVGTDSPQGVVDVVSDTSAIVLPRNIDPDGPDDISNNEDDGVFSPVEGMIVYDQSKKAVRYFDGETWKVINFVGNEELNNEGVVKINGDASGEPAIIITNTNDNVYQKITYNNLPLSLAAEPTTSWPENIEDPQDTDIYDAVTDNFLENVVAGQVHFWRVVVDYSKTGSGASSEVKVTLKLENESNSNSDFILEKSESAYSTSGTLSYLMMTVAGDSSLPAPYGNGNGYGLYIKASARIDLYIKSITRVSTAKD